jgi:hypothetical protein
MITKRNERMNFKRYLFCGLFYLFCLAGGGIHELALALNHELPADFPQTQVVMQSQALLDHVVHTVVDKSQLPPSGDKHDWVSQAPYWWPDRAHPSGPYVRQDGKRNPEIDRWTDEKYFSDMLRTSEQLSQAYVGTSDERYAQKITEILRAWFMDEATKMNPHLEFGQFIPGRTMGRGEGIISTRFIYKIPQIIHRIERSKSWQDQDRLKMQTWFKAYYSWLTTSKIGLQESRTLNNHLTWYLVQKASIEIYLNRLDEAHQTLEFVLDKVVPNQINIAGLQPRELERTKSFSYSSMNLNAFWILAYLTKEMGLDFTHHPNARLVFMATDSLLAYDGVDRWPFQQITEGATQELCPALNWAQYFSSDEKYIKASAQFNCPLNVESYFIKHGL